MHLGSYLSQMIWRHGTREPRIQDYPRSIMKHHPCSCWPCFPRRSRLSWCIREHTIYSKRINKTGPSSARNRFGPHNPESTALFRAASFPLFPFPFAPGFSFRPSNTVLEMSSRKEGGYVFPEVRLYETITFLCLARVKWETPECQEFLKTMSQKEWTWMMEVGAEDGLLDALPEVAI